MNSDSDCKWLRTLVSLSSRGDPERELHRQPRLVGAGLPDLRDDTGPVALPQAQGARQAGGGGQTSS